MIHYYFPIAQNIGVNKTVSDKIYRGCVCCYICEHILLHTGLIPAYAYLYTYQLFYQISYVQQMS